jgi:hypothetical protein
VTEPVAGTENWDTFPVQTLPLNQPIDCADGVRITITGSAAAIVQTAVPEYGARALKPAPTCTIRFDMEGTFQALWVDHKGGDPSHNVLSFYDVRNNLVKTSELNSINSPVLTYIPLSVPCAYCLAEFSDHLDEVVVDSVRWGQRQ